MTVNDRRFNPAEVHKLEDPERLSWMPPTEVVARLRLAPGMMVADIGAGTGFFTIPMAQAVAPGGHVYAVDMEPALLKFLAAKLEKPEAPRNIEILQGEATHTTLHPDSCDVALLANIWHELDDYAAVLREGARILKANARLAILDWRPDTQRPPGPPLEHRVSLDAATRTLRENGWKLLDSGVLGGFSYLVVAERPGIPH